MLKKLVIVGIVGFVAVAAVKGSKFGSYIRSEYEALKARAEANIPPEQEIKRLRNEIKQLDKDILAVVGQLARERVEVAQLKERADELRAKQSKDKEILNARAQAIKNATEFVTFGNRKLPIDQAKSELEDGVRRYTANEKSLVAMDTAVTSREKVKETLEKQLETLKNQKGELAAAVDALEAEITALKLQQMESKYQTDDSRLGQIKEDIRALKTKIEIEREKLKLLPAVLDTPSKETSNKTVDQIMAPIAGTPAKSGEATMPVIE
jgi:peptidoglycan hydrolase CwlO-like protein